MSAETLAARIGVSAATVYRWEKGDIEKVPATILEPLAEALQTTPQFLIGWDKAPEEPKNQGEPVYLKHGDVRILAKGFDRMPEEERRKALELARMVFEKYASYFEEGADDDDDNP